MDQRGTAKLEALPQSTDNYWKDSEVEQQKQTSKTIGDKCDHYFIHRTSMEVECRDCHIGYFLVNEDEEIRNGRIYIKNKLVV